MSGGVVDSGWIDPRPLIEARPLYSAMLDPRSDLRVDRSPSAGLSVLLALSGHELLWLVHAISVGMWRTTARESAYWLTEAAQSSPEVLSYLATFEIPPDGIPFAATVIVEAFGPDRLSAAAQLLGVSHRICWESCTFGETVDVGCYYSCMLES